MVRDNDILKTLIVDDERPARREMKRMLGKIEGLEILGEAGDGLAAIALIAQHRPDIILLDIQMPGLDGFQVIEKLKDSGALPSIIFVTAYDQYAIKAFKFSALDYLLKPVDADDLVAAVNKADQMVTEELKEQLDTLTENMQTDDKAKKKIVLKTSLTKTVH